MKQIQDLLETKISNHQQEMYAFLLAGQRESAEHSAHRIACLAELELEIGTIYKRLKDA